MTTNRKIKCKYCKPKETSMKGWVVCEKKTEKNPFTGKYEIPFIVPDWECRFCEHNELNEKLIV